MSLKIDIYSLEATWFDGMAESLLAPGLETGLEIFPGHIPIVVQLGIGPLVVRQKEDESIFFITGGLLHVQHNHVLILADEAQSAGDLDEFSVEQKRKEALHRLYEQTSAMDYSQVLLEVAYARQQLRTIKRRNRT